jgi:hypothetical protein
MIFSIPSFKTPYEPFTLVVFWRNCRQPHGRNFAKTTTFQVFAFNLADFIFNA